MGHPIGMTDLSTFGGRLRYLRKKKGVTQAEAAGEAGVARPTYTGYENGGDLPARETLVKLADFFEASLDWIEGRVAKVNMPEIGQFVDDPEKLTMLALWDGMDRDMRHHFFAVLKASPPRRRDVA